MVWRMGTAGGEDGAAWSLIDYLQGFNRKERFLLVGAALGNARFTLAADFRAGLAAALSLDIPAGAFVAMDYHLDWLYASLYLHRHGGARGPHPNADRLVRAQQEDVDLLVAYQTADASHLVLLEAKGATGWSNAQFRSKAVRFREIFGEDGRAWSGIVPHFVLASPRRPQRLDTEGCPSWMLPAGALPWVELRMRADPLKVTRCDETGRSSQHGQFWAVVRA
jgi:hypothetical protein